MNARIREFKRDTGRLDVSGYDLTVSDFEPMTAWAATRAGKFCLGIGHQYAFNHKIPVAGDNLVARAIMRWFAPATLGLGLHWHHFGQLILPPIIPGCQPAPDTESKHGPTLVYLPFEDQQQVISLLHQFKDTRFDLFTNDYPGGTHLNVEVAPQSFSEFQRALRACAGVICNAGFELSSEALQLGKKLLVKPLAGQMEQASNAAALRELGLGATMTALDTAMVGEWLAHGQATRVDYPNVPAAISDWLVQSDYSRPETLVESLWSETSCEQLPHLFAAPANQPNFFDEKSARNARLAPKFSINCR